ncbi:MAG: class I SAM-dependent methyltransferase [Stenotrophomonas sp.]
MNTDSLGANACPCCLTSETLRPAPGYTHCSRCGHRWRLPHEESTTSYYQALTARNNPQAPWFKQKTADRIAALSLLLEDGGIKRILEVGCAEGELGAAIKARFGVAYDGVELSQDRKLAERKLDRVFSIPADQVISPLYQLIASFHVLEHIAQPEQELAAWSRLLAADGQLLVEVPNEAGHPLLADDRNPEHLHQFTPASLTLLLARCGFACHGLSVGHYESPVYPDSIRVVARPQPSPAQQRNQLLQRFRDRIGGPFIVYGIGGDFLNYLAPLADSLDIHALLDSSPDKWGQQFGRHLVRAYDPGEHGKLPVLICSIRFGADIRQSLLALGITENRIIGLESIYECHS